MERHAIFKSFFTDKRNIEAMSNILNRTSTDKDETRIEGLDMSVMLYNGLKKHKILTLGEMKVMTWNRFNSVRGVGKKAWEEMQTIINTFR